MSDVVVFNAPATLAIDEIRELLAPVLRRHGARQAFLIGSYAHGTADAWSDIDIVVVMPTNRLFVERAMDLTDVLDVVPVAVDLFVYTPEEFAAGVQRDRGIFHIVRREGVALL